jgi:chromosome segregation ATPase
MSLEATPSQAPETAAAPSASAPAPQPSSALDVNHDSVLRFEGKEIPFSKLRGLESEHTKATQALSEARRQASAYQQAIQERDAQIQRFRQAAGTQPNAQADALAQLRALSYVSGEEAAGIVEHMQGQNRQLQAIAYMLAQKIAQLEQNVSGVTGQYANQNFSSKIAKFRDQLQIPERFQKRLEELYLAYEGDDLDDEFPRIAKEWYDDIQAGFQDVQKARIEAARRGPFIPGKGGQGSPSRPLEMKGNETPAEQAEQVGRMFGLFE